MLRLLLVDDEPVSLRFLSKALAGLGATEEARDGAEAVELFRKAREQGRPFAAVVMDIMMPGMDGIEAVRRIRALEAQAGAEPCRVLMLSCLDDAEHQIGAQYEAGADGYLTKPVDLATLRRALANLDLPANLLDAVE
mgnify:CR=1 FL=1